MDQLVALLPLILIMGGFMYFASRRQKKAMQATINLHNSLRIGDRVSTTAGLMGKIVRITDDNVDLEIAPGVVTTWLKMAIRERIEPGSEIIDTPSTATEIDTPEPITDPNGLKYDR